MWQPRSVGAVSTPLSAAERDARLVVSERPFNLELHIPRRLPPRLGDFLELCEAPDP